MVGWRCSDKWRYQLDPVLLNAVAPLIPDWASLAGFCVGIVCRVSRWELPNPINLRRINAEIVEYVWPFTCLLLMGESGFCWRRSYVNCGNFEQRSF